MIETADILTESLLEALETMAFMTTAEPEEEQAPPEDVIFGEMRFTGPKDGHVQILAGRSFCEVLAENIAALEEADDAACCDAMQELSNVTCGLVLPRLAESSDDVFGVSVPTVKIGDAAPQWQEFVSAPRTCVMEIEDFVVAARLIIE